MDAVSSLRQSLKRMSFRRSSGRGRQAQYVEKVDMLSNEFVQYRGVSVSFLQSFIKDVVSGTLGADIDLLVW